MHRQGYCGCEDCALLYAVNHRERTICTACVPKARQQISRAEMNDGASLFRQLWLTPPEPLQCQWCETVTPDCFHFLERSP